MSQNPNPTPGGAHRPASGAGDPDITTPGAHPPPPSPPPYQQDQAGPGQAPWAAQQAVPSSPVPPSGMPPSPVPPPATGPRPQAREEERTFAVLAHLSPIIAAVLSVGWLTILGPLVIWAFYKERSPLVRQAAAGAFNFNLVIWAAIIAGWICLFTVILIPLTLILWLAAGIVGLVCHIQGAVKASRGEPYRYPFSIPVLS